MLTCIIKSIKQITFPLSKFIFLISSISSLTESIAAFAEIGSSTEHELPCQTITDEDFQTLLWNREQGLVGFQHNLDRVPIISAPDDAVLNWQMLSQTEKERLVIEQEKMFLDGKISMIVLAGGEATRFGCPKPFIKVSDDLGEFLEIKAANIHWLQTTFGKSVPFYIFCNEVRLDEFKKMLADRKYYGLNPTQIRWFVQETVNTFIPTLAELSAQYANKELTTHLTFNEALRRENPDGIYRFQGKERKIPPGHFDALAAFIISGLYSEALKQGIEFVSVVNIDNLQAILKNDGMFAHFAESRVDFGFLLTEKNLFLKIRDKSNNKIIQDNLIVRFRDNVLSFDGLDEFSNKAVKDGYQYVINQIKMCVDVYDENGSLVDTETTTKSEVGGTLVQLADESGHAVGEPVMREGFQLPANFDHVNAPYFNTNTVIINLRNFLKFLEKSEEQIGNMSIHERRDLVREKLINQIKPNFEFKNHEVKGEYPLLGIVKDGKTKILVMQITRIMLQASHLKGAKSGFIFAPRSQVWMPVKEPGDRIIAAKNCRESLKKYTLRASSMEEF